ncbi:helix-turn-helix domain-containing protein [Gracilibacillus salitolerans]|uniref:Helix-turn-helix domain-containing protein n=1 Tax=Gracilibacillus salitolerans TaxID=2663022 RepID=A0A5Q2TSZ8_9BACI|nr:AraC family transcriptional regulator [Gracilibacillus salitolerans]QGH35908.1 helix-turn-helix domain-containing protein [Gracilibacillus salitolerans]
MRELHSQTSMSFQEEHVPGFLIHHKKDRSPMNVFHRHHGYEIVWLKDGEALYVFEEKVYHLRKNTILLFKSSEFHRVSLREGAAYERVVVMFTEDFLSFDHVLIHTLCDFLDQLPSPHFMMDLFIWHAEKLQMIIDNLLLEDQNQNNWQQKTALELYLLELILFLCREIKDENQHDYYLTVEQQQSNPVAFHDQIIKEINEIWNTDWRLEVIAEKLLISKYYLCRFFKKEFGVTIQEYILQRRLFEANKLLTDTTIPVHKIAEHVGFMSDSSFIRRFKDRTGMTPNQYRKSQDKLRNIIK